VLLSLDFLYTPSVDVDRAVERWVGGLGAVLVWRIAALGTVVAALRVAETGPLLLFADHLEGEDAIAIHRVADHAAAVARLRELGVRELREVELPPGPCATFSLTGMRLGVYELTRPHAVEQLASRGSRR
jgi:hypothetical protein